MVALGAGNRLPFRLVHKLGGSVNCARGCGATVRLGLPRSPAWPCKKARRNTKSLAEAEAGSSFGRSAYSRGRRSRVSWPPFVHGRADAGGRAFAALWRCQPPPWRVAAAGCSLRIDLAVGAGRQFVLAGLHQVNHDAGGGRRLAIHANAHALDAVAAHG